jgi:ribosomal-protein-alanine N-acetyltransferase
MEMSTERLVLQLESPDEVRERLASMPPEVIREVSPEWRARVEAATEPDPWLHGFAIRLRSSPDQAAGSIGFKGPPDKNSVVEVAYGIDEEHQGKGYATEAVHGILEFVSKQTQVSVVRAHTLPSKNASTAVLEKCGFQFLGEVSDPEDGQVWRWERAANVE